MVVENELENVGGPKKVDDGAPANGKAPKAKPATKKAGEKKKRFRSTKDEISRDASEL